MDHRRQDPATDLCVLHAAPISSSRRLTGLYHSVPGLLRGLREVGADAALLATGKSGFDHVDCFPVFQVADLGRFPTLRRCSPPYDRPDLVGFHSTYIPAHAFLARECERRDIPYVITPRGGMTRGAQSVKRWKKRLGNMLFFSRMVGKAAAIHCLTEAEAQDTRRWGRPVFVVGNGVELPPDDQVAQPSAGSRLRFLYLGRLDPNHKGLDRLLDACRLARADLQAGKARLILRGPDIDGSAQLLKDMVRAYGLEDIVRIAGPVLGEEKAWAFSSSDVFVHTSRFEGHPMAVLEALSYGLPCLLTPGTNMAAEVSSCGAGWEAGSTPDDIAAALSIVIDERERLRSMGRQGRDLVASRYAWRQVADQLVRQYERIVP